MIRQPFVTGYPAWRKGPAKATACPTSASTTLPFLLASPSASNHVPPPSNASPSVPVHELSATVKLTALVSLCSGREMDPSHSASYRTMKASCTLMRFPKSPGVDPSANWGYAAATRGYNRVRNKSLNHGRKAGISSTATSVVFTLECRTVPHWPPRKSRWNASTHPSTSLHSSPVNTGWRDRKTSAFFCTVGSNNARAGVSLTFSSGTKNASKSL
mmetsp:Transcript_1395/g.2920  ORF Transcript_1395/g.2920 Transcript_1395/m.2920 type:complete len:216 (+) Transcript_1395:788-1435(+)